MSRRNPADNSDSNDEAEEVHDHVQQQQERIFYSESQGEDLIEDAERDYNRIAELDVYQDDNGADAEEIEINPEDRRRAERELNKRDRVQKQGQDVDQYIQDDYQQMLARRRAFYKQGLDNNDDSQDDSIDQNRYIDIEECKGQLAKWIGQGHTKKYIKRKFINFLSLFAMEGQRIYYKQMVSMLHENRQSIEISYEHFKEALPTLSMWLGLQPQILLPQLNAILYTHLVRMSHNYANIVKDVYVKFYQLPIHDRIPELKVQHIGKLVNVKGVVTTRGEVFNQLKKVTYKCYRCGQLKGPYLVTNKQITLGPCRSCQSNGPYLQQRNRSIYRNHQKVVLQQSPSQVQPGRIPRTKQVLLFGDNVDKLKPGQQAHIIGIYMIRYDCSLNMKQGFPVMSTFVEANSIKKVNDVGDFSAIDEEAFIKFSKRADMAYVIYNSIAPSIYGHQQVKQAIAFSLFGGTQKRDQKKMHSIRGDINVLLLGDPGIAKSQFLKSIQKVFPKCVYATGKGASAVGLTATVKPDPQTNQWKLQAGAMVLADKGVCLIDQFDKMNDHDRTSIHEAMQQQTISISKAGIVATLKARCAVIAAANPIKGVYDQQLNFADNVNLSQPILSRFDIVKVMKDRAVEDIDYQLSTFVINSHMENHPYMQAYSCSSTALSSKVYQEQSVSPQFLKQYIKYARERCLKTIISDKCAKSIQDFYLQLRECSQQHGGIKMTTRQLQSMIRICQAHARMHLRQQTLLQDAEVAKRAMFRSYVETQKHGAANKITSLKAFMSYKI